MKILISIIALTILAAATYGGEQPASDSESPARSAGFRQDLSSNDPVVLRAIILAQNQQIESLKAQLAELKGGAATTQSTETRKTDAVHPVKQIVLPPADYKALPRGAYRNGTAKAFTELQVDAVGYVNAGMVVRIVDESTVIVEIAVETGPTFSRQLIIEGVPTKGHVDNTWWYLNSWFKVVSTREYNGTTYAVAQQILQADKTHPASPKPIK